MSSFATLIALAALVSILVSYRAYITTYGALPFVRWVDICLLALLLGIVCARIAHVLLNPAYFAGNLAEALDPRRGGLHWSGALIGAFFGIFIASRWRKLPLMHILDALTPALPLISLAVWTACIGGRCGYGAEIPTLAYISPLAAAELPDVYGIVAPRYQTQLWGQLWSLALLVLWGILYWRSWLIGKRFWLIFSFTLLGLLLIGIYQG